MVVKIQAASSLTGAFEFPQSTPIFSVTVEPSQIKWRVGDVISRAAIPVWQVCACAAFALLLAGCESTREKVDQNMITRDETRQIAEQPFKDVNLTHDEIPPLLQAAVENPYAPPKPYRCDAIQHEVADLAVVLGPDFDDPHDPNSGVTREKAMDLARNAASSWIPFRWVVRWASGADRHAREMRRAVLAGIYT